MTTGDPFPPAAIMGAREAAKAFLRIGTDAEDALIGALAATALEIAEAFLGAATIARGFATRVPADGGWHPLGTAPVSVITSVAVADQPLAVDGYAVDIDADARGWVRAAGGGYATASFRAGLGDGWDTLPAAVAQGVVLLVAYLFEQRAGDAAPPAAVAALWRPFRRLRLGASAVCEVRA